MPLYEYLCEKCGERFEVMQKFADAPLETHEKCGGAVHRLISAPALQFIGSGWYVTDYANAKGEKPADNGAKKADAPATPASGSESAGSTKSSETKSSETKSRDTKSESKPSASSSESK